MQSSENSTVFVGALQPTTTQAFLTSYFANFGQVVHLNLRQNGLGECVGFGFVQMSSPDEVSHILANCPHYFMGKLIDVKLFKKTTDDQKVFIGGLHLETTDDSLRRYFEQFGEVEEVGVRLNLATGRSRGFGIVTFTDLRTVDRVLALKDVTIDGKRVEVKRLVRNQPGSERMQPGAQNAYTNDFLESAYSNNKNKLFVGGMHLGSDETALRSFYSQFGEIKSCNIALDKTSGKRRGFGFVQYEDAESVERCMAARPHSIDNHQVETKRALTNDDTKNMFTVMKLFVGGLKAQHTADKLTQYFSQFGNVTHVQMSRGSEPDGHKGFAFVMFDDYDPVDKVIASKPHVIEGGRVDCTKGLSKDEMSKMEQQRQRDLSSREQRTMANNGGMAGGVTGGGYAQYGYGAVAATVPVGYGMSSGYGATPSGPSTNWLGINTGSYGYGYATGAGPTSTSSMGPEGMNMRGGSDSASRMRATGVPAPARTDSAGGYSNMGMRTNGSSNGGAAPAKASGGGGGGSSSDNRIRGPAFKQLLQSAEVSGEAIKTLELENLLDSSLVMSLTTDEFMNLPLRMGDRKRIEYALKALSEA